MGLIHDQDKGFVPASLLQELSNGCRGRRQIHFRFSLDESDPTGNLRRFEPFAYRLLVFHQVVRQFGQGLYFVWRDP